MSKDPAFLFYHQDFFSGVSDMTNEEIGAYVKCLCVQASKGGITDKHMLIICNSQDIHVTVKSKFVFNDDIKLFENIRLKTEIEKRKKYSESRSNNRKNKTKPKSDSFKNPKTYEQHMEDENENEDTNEVLIVNGFNYKESLLKFVSNETLVSDYVLMRQTKNASLTETAFNLLIKECQDNNFSIEKALEIAIQRNWTGFKVEWVENITKNTNNGKPTVTRTRNRP